MLIKLRDVRLFGGRLCCFFADVSCAIYVDRNTITYGRKRLRKFCLPYEF